MIEIRNLTKSFVLSGGERHYIFRDLNFAFPDDVNIGLMGRNGAGKSTLLRLLGGIDWPDRGGCIPINAYLGRWVSPVACKARLQAEMA